jgi:hypothetical protein
MRSDDKIKYAIFLFLKVANMETSCGQQQETLRDTRNKTEPRSGLQDDDDSKVQTKEKEVSAVQ